MSYRSSQLSPHMVTRSSRNIFVSTPSHPRSQGFRDTQFWQGWHDRREIGEPHRESGFINWSKVSGLAITLAIGASFWTGVGMLVVRLWK